MFWIEDNACGSGHPYYIRGWAVKLYNAYASGVGEFPRHVAFLPYKNKETGRMFYKTAGLFYSEVEEEEEEEKEEKEKKKKKNEGTIRPQGGYLIPKYGHLLFEIEDADVFNKMAFRDT